MSSGETRATRLDADVAKTGALLLALVLHNLIYPLSTGGGVGPVIFYLMYASMFVVATWLMSRSKVLRLAAAASGAAVFVAGLANSYAPNAAAAMAVYLSSIAYHGVIIVVLARYTFAARQVFTDVILAATSLYLIIGSTFAAVYALVEALAPGSFASASGTPLGWQQLLYFSYVTLTSLGYGDILPTGFHAQAFAAFEAIVGVLYTVILLSRLVGMHTSAGSPRDALLNGEHVDAHDHGTDGRLRAARGSSARSAGRGAARRVWPERPGRSFRSGSSRPS